MNKTEKEMELVEPYGTYFVSNFPDVHNMAIGITLDWTQNGFGQLKIEYDLQDNKWRIDSELMGREFAKKVLNWIVDNAVFDTDGREKHE